MVRDSQNESPVKPEGVPKEAVTELRHLLPSNQDIQKFMAGGKLTVEPRCDLPDYTIEHFGEIENLVQTPKRQEYDQLAQEALNNLDQSDGKAASEQEKSIAKEVAELSLKAQKDLSTLTENRHRDHDIQQLSDIFHKLDPESAQRVINEANKSLDSQSLRIAQSAVGEIWMGAKDTKGSSYYLHTLLKGVDCSPSV